MRRMVGVVAIAAVLAGGCGSTTETSDSASTSSPAAAASVEDVRGAAIPAGSTFVGAVPGTTFKLGLIATGDAAWAYLCDEQGQALGLTGTLADGEVDLAQVDGDAAVTGTIAGSTFTGSVVLDGAPIEVTATPATGDEGVFWKIGGTGGTTFVSAWVRDGNGVVGNKTTFSVAGSSDAGPLVDETSGGVPTDAEPMGLIGAAKCFMASRRLAKATKELQNNPSMGAAANQQSAFEEQVAICRDAFS